MKTTLPLRTVFILVFVSAYLLRGNSVNAQTYTTIANGLWNLPSTWQGGITPPAGNIGASAVINIKHIVTYTGASFSNNGTINLTNQQGISPKLLVPSGVNITNNVTGKIYIINAEYRQYRFVGGLELGLAQTGSFVNTGGYVQVANSFVEVAQDWVNQSSGTVVFRNSSLAIGRGYDLKSSIDTIESASISVGMHGTGDYTADGNRVFFFKARFQVASSNGKFNLKDGTMNGSIDYIMLKNHVLNTYSTSQIDVGSNIVTTGLVLKAYCIANQSNYRPNGKIIGTQTPDCSLNYFPAGLMGSTSAAALNFSAIPALVSGTALSVGAVYKYEGVTPGVDALVKIDSLVGGATIVKLDDNTGGLGYIEGFQPEIKSGSPLQSYGVFTFTYKVTGTSLNHSMNTFGLTALDVDGSNTVREFSEIDLGAGATAAYMVSPTNISITSTGPGTYRGISANGQDNSGIDTVGFANMFTVTNSNVSSFRLKLGVVKTSSAQTSRQYGIYMKGFVYPGLSTLPVELKYFNAALDIDLNKVDLNWVTVTEKNVSHFMIEKSSDGKNFSEAGLVFAIGNSTEAIKYYFGDKNINTAKAGVIYYRLRSVDMDGTFEYSVIRIITISNQNKQSLSIQTYPNPVSNDLRITIPAGWQGKKVVYEVINSNGQIAKKATTGNASQTETINVNSLAPGFYLARAICEGEITQQKIIKR